MNRTIRKNYSVCGRPFFIWGGIVLLAVCSVALSRSSTGRDQPLASNTGLVRRLVATPPWTNARPSDRKATTGIAVSDTTCPAYYTLAGAVDNVNFGFSVAGAGDVNKDGYADFIVGDDAALPRHLSAAGSAYVYSGRDGALLYRKDGDAAGDWFGFSVDGAGDVNSDGYADFIVGTHAPVGYFSVYSGHDGSLLYRKYSDTDGDGLGSEVAGGGDINNDGYSDFIVGAPGADPSGKTWAGSAYVYSGYDGTVLYQKDGTATYDLFGYSVAGAGDVNRDGYADFIIGAYLADPGGSSAAGSAHVYSGKDGSLLYQKAGVPGEMLGISVAGAGDIDDDGFADFIAGADYASPGNRTRAGSAYVYSGRNGALLYRKDGAAAEDRFGRSVAGAGDVNNDGYDDFLVGTAVANPGGLAKAGSAYLYSGRDGSLLSQKNGTAAEQFFGGSVAGTGDINRDGHADFIVGATATGNGGYAIVYSCGCSCTCHADPECDSEVGPRGFHLWQNYPNPFNAGTVMAFDLPNAADWSLTVYNVAGQAVRTFGGQSAAGRVTQSWDGTDAKSELLSSGVYFYRVKANEFSATKKMLLLK